MNSNTHFIRCLALASVCWLWGSNQASAQLDRVFDTDGGNVGGTVTHSARGLWGSTPPQPEAIDEDDRSPVVADVHTDPTRGEVLEEGTGYAGRIFVV
ncbi:MAG: DUF3160 domain-containing protein, partial [Pirellulales bacterium]|nr:DUF3160 domain-containing protein [Pirellulales bacterium]